jgi:GH15 family glucan-1,4-alpha-glucosidase
MDGALLEGINFAVITNPNEIRSTLSRMSLLKTDSGGYRRVLQGTDEYEFHEFLFINFSLARAHIRLGNPATADVWVERMQHKAAGDNNLIPEMYVSSLNQEFPGPVGAPAGSIPMAGYGAGSYILYLMERQTGGVDGVVA